MNVIKIIIIWLLKNIIFVKLKRSRISNGVYGFHPNILFRKNLNILRAGASLDRFNFIDTI